MEESALIRHLQKGDARALEAIIRQYTNYVSATAYRVLGPLPREDLEEVVADTFVTLWTHAGDLEPDRGTLRAWLGAVAANKAKDRLRRYRPLELLTEDLPDGGSLEEETEAKALGKVLWQAVDSLDEPERTLFFRYYYEGEKLKTVARDLGLNPSTAKTKLFRGRQVLREKLRKLGGEALA